MTGLLQILVVEDDPDFQKMYRGLLAAEGYDAVIVDSRSAAIEQLRAHVFHAAIVDQNLQGKDGPDDGLDLIGEAGLRSAHVLVVTAYPSREKVERAFARGAQDYLVKDEYLDILLPRKLALVREVVRARVLASGHAGAKRRELYASLDVGTPHARGRRLEELALLVSSIPGLVCTSRSRTAVDEIDILVRNESPDPFIAKLGRYFLVECKNWMGRVGTPEIGWCATKVEVRRGVADLAFFIARHGFSEPVETLIHAKRAQGVHIATIDQDDLLALVDGPDVTATLKSICDRRLAGPG